MRLTRRILSNRARLVDFRFPWKNQQLADGLLRLMRQENGIGLAATQCGINARVFVMEINDRSWCCFNPTISEIQGEIVEYAEGCLSFPKDQCIIKRPASVKVDYFDHQGNAHTEELTGLVARCFQHELDHLNGITMWERYEEQNAKQS